MTGVDILAPRQFFDDLGRPVPQAFTIDHDKGSGIGLDGVSRLDVGGPVAPDDLPIRATWQNPAGKLRASNRAAKNADHPPLAIRRLTEAGDGLELGVDCEDWLFAQHYGSDPLELQLVTRSPFDPVDGRP